MLVHHYKLTVLWCTWQFQQLFVAGKQKKTEETPPGLPL